MQDVYKISVPLVIKPTVYRCSHSCAELLPAKCVRRPTTPTFPPTTPIGPGHTSMKIAKINKGHHKKFSLTYDLQRIYMNTLSMI